MCSLFQQQNTFISCDHRGSLAKSRSGLPPPPTRSIQMASSVPWSHTTLKADLLISFQAKKAPEKVRSLIEKHSIAVSLGIWMFLVWGATPSSGHSSPMQTAVALSELLPCDYIHSVSHEDYPYVELPLGQSTTLESTYLSCFFFSKLIPNNGGWNSPLSHVHPLEMLGAALTLDRWMKFIAIN